jgi:hypothetical protein
VDPNTVCIESFLSIGWCTFICLKKTAKGLHYFGLDCGMFFGILQIFYSRAVIQRTIVDFPAFLEHCLAEKIAVGAHTTCVPNK